MRLGGPDAVTHFPCNAFQQLQLLWLLLLLLWLLLLLLFQACVSGTCVSGTCVVQDHVPQARLLHTCLLLRWRAAPS